MELTRRTFVASWPLLGAATLAGLSPAAAQTPEHFYKGKTLRILLGHPPGGSYDFYARLAADFIKKYIPGNPNVVVEYKPGGGGVLAAAFFYAQAPRDGTMIGLFPETLAHTQILDPAVGGKWNVEEMSYIGSFAPVNTAFIVRKDAPATTPEAMKTKEIIVGCSGVNSQSYQYPAMLRALGGFKFKTVCGYPGSAEYVLALQKGEVDLISSAWNNLRVTSLEDIKAGNLIPVIQGGIKRNEELANVPLMQELVSDPQQKKVIEFASTGAAIGRALIAPPKIPADRLAALREAFDQLVKDPEFILVAAKRNLELDPTPGAEVQKYADKIVNAPKDLIAEAAKAMGG